MDPDCVVDLIFLEFDDEDGVRAAKKGSGDADADWEEEEGEEVATVVSTSATLSSFFIVFFLATSSSNCLALRSCAATSGSYFLEKSSLMSRLSSVRRNLLGLDR